MALASHVYTKAIKTLVDKGANLETDALKVMLLATYTIGTTQDTAQFVSDVLAGPAGESAGPGYTAGGQLLTGVTLTLTAASHLYTLTCANPSWTVSAAGSLAAAYALFYDSTPVTTATQPVLLYWDLNGTQTSTNSGASVPFTLTINASGLLTFTGA